MAGGQQSRDSKLEPALHAIGHDPLAALGEGLESRCPGLLTEGWRRGPGHRFNLPGSVCCTFASAARLPLLVPAPAGCSGCSLLSPLVFPSAQLLLGVLSAPDAPAASSLQRDSQQEHLFRQNLGICLCHKLPMGFSCRRHLEIHDFRDICKPHGICTYAGIQSSLEKAGDSDTGCGVGEP